MYFEWYHTTLTPEVNTLHLTDWILNKDGRHPRKLFLSVGNRTGEWVTVENLKLGGGETISFNQRVSIDPHFKQIQQRDLNMVRAIHEAGGKMKVVHKKSGREGVTCTSIAKMEKGAEMFVHEVDVYWSSM
jgi:hypothetical protein